MENSFRSGFVGVVGIPNMGKSSLVNQLIGEKVGIVSEKPQTTRKSVVGIYSNKEMQALFVDAPGFIKADKGLNKFLQDEAGSVTDKSDVLMLLLTTEGHNTKTAERALEEVSRKNKPWFVVINKMDTNKTHRVLILEELVKKYDVPIFRHSTVESLYDQSNEILAHIKTLLPKSPGPLYDTESFTTSITRDWVSEVIREKCFELLHQELPFNMAVQVQKFEESTAKSCVKIYTDIIVTKKNHCSMVIGKKGQMIKEIGQKARLEIEDLLGEKVYLELFTKVKPSWMEDKRMLKELGYVVEKDS